MIQSRWRCAVLICLLFGQAQAADELDFLGRPMVRSERAISSQQQALWILPFEPTQYQPAQPTPLMRKAMEAQQAGRYLDAVSILEGAPEQASADVQLLRAGYYLQGDQTQTAQQILDALISQHPALAEAHALKAMAYLQQGKPDAAWSEAQAAQRLGRTPLVVRIASYVLQAQGKLGDARALMADLNASGKPDALSLAREAELALSHNDKEHAGARAAAARELEPASPYVLAVSGLVWLLEDQLQPAQEAFEQALRRDPEDAKALLGLGLAKARQGKMGEGIVYLRKAARSEPSSAVIQTYLGRALYQTGRTEEAQAAYQRAIKLDPQDPAPWVYLAQLQSESGQPGEALNSLKEASTRKTARAVYRGESLLNEDEQTLQANLAETYRRLGLNGMAWLALTEGAGEKNAVTLKNQAEALQGRRFGETARRSLALQSLFNDALDALPVTLDVYGDGAGQSGVSAPQHGVVEGLSGQQASYGDYGALFAAPTHVRVDGVVANRRTWSEQIRGALGGGQFGFSLAQLHYETDGFSDFNSLDNTTWQGVLKWDLLDSTRLFLSYQNFDSDRSDIFFPGELFLYSPVLVQDENWVARLGLRQRLGDGGELRALLSRQRTNQTVHDVFFDFDTLLPSGESDSGEFQYRQTNKLGLFVAGAQTYREEAEFFGRYFDIGLGEFVTYPVGANKVRAGQVYVAQKIQLDEHWVVDLGLGRAWLKNKDALSGTNTTELRRWTPRLGLVYTPAPETRVRLALGQNLGLRNAGSATLAPVETAGIVHVRPDDADRFVRSAGLGFDHRVGGDWLVSGEAQVRRAWLPSIDIFTGGQVLNEFTQRDGELKLGWIPANGHVAAALSAGYERRTAPEGIFVLDSVQKQRLRELKLSAHWFAGRNLSLKGEVSRNWVDGDYQVFFPPASYRDATTRINASLQWKLPQGQFEFGVRNLLDDDFEYTESDPLAPRFSKGRFVYGTARFGW